MCLTKCPYNTELRCRRNQRPYAARSPRRGLLPIAVGEEDEGRRTYGTQSCRAVRPRRGRISMSQTGSCVSTDGRPLRVRSLRCWTVRRFVGQALLAYGYSDSPPPGTLQPTRGSGNNIPLRHRGTMPSKPASIHRTGSPKGASPNSRRRGGRRTTNLRNTIVQGRASPKGANIG